MLTAGHHDRSIRKSKVHWNFDYPDLVNFMAINSHRDRVSQSLHNAAQQVDCKLKIHIITVKH